MTKTFFFYDLETSGLSARSDRVMQFAGQRTGMDLKPIGEPVNVLVKLNDDTLPSPDAIMVTGITPQQTVQDGHTEAEFAKILAEQIFTPDTIAVGFNNIRFDDEFVRHLFWRNFYDPYEWTWKDGRSRWDLLDVVRMTRALRPEGIEWPVVDGKPVNKLELIAAANGMSHEKAHDALSDVEALIQVTQLIKTKQPQLYEYLLDMRDKAKVQKLVNLDDKKPFVYSSGRYSAEFDRTTVAFPLTSGRNKNVVVYDLRHDPTEFISLTPEELKKRMYATYEERKKDGYVAIPVKELQYNRAPAVAPLGVLTQNDGWDRLKLDPEIIEKHSKLLIGAPHFAENIRSLYESRPEFTKYKDAEEQLYDSFVSDRDRLRVETVRNATERELADFHPEFTDDRLPNLLVRYKARSFPGTLNEGELAQWEQWRSARLQSQLPGYVSALQRLSTTVTDDNKQFLLQELQLWAESIIEPAEE
jgi:exodeoxyribonuclease-1